MRGLVRSALVMALLSAATSASAAVITFTDVQLGTGAGFTYSQGGLTMTVSASAGGALAKIGSGQFTGLHIPGFVNVSSGLYTFSFSETIGSVEVEFDALSSTGGTPPETIGTFGTNAGGFTLSYLDQAGTLFDGSTITAAVGDGQGIFTLTGPAFSSFSFVHAQNPAQNGFVIERITVNTDGAVVPEPSSMLLLGTAIAGLVARRVRASR
jgi:hypothetical protein